MDYWHGEGTASRSGPQSAEREPTDTPSLPVINALTVAVSDPGADAAAGSALRTAALGQALGGVGLSATVVELDPGAGSAPYHYEHGREEWVLILSGSATLRHPGGEDLLAAGDVVCFAEGPGGAHHMFNHSSDVMRAIFFSTTGLPANVCYPESGTWVLRNGPDDADVMLRDGGLGEERGRLEGKRRERAAATHWRTSASVRAGAASAPLRPRPWSRATARDPDLTSRDDAKARSPGRLLARLRLAPRYRAVALGRRCRSADRADGREKRDRRTPGGETAEFWVTATRGRTSGLTGRASGLRDRVPRCVGR